MSRPTFHSKCFSHIKVKKKRKAEKIKQVKELYKWVFINWHWSPLMELNKDLQTLIERAWALGHKITKSCDIVSETPVGERERLIGIRDSLKQVENMLMFLQRLRSWQVIDKHAAFGRLEESRLILMEKVSEYPGRELDVVKDLNSNFGNGKAAFNWNVRNPTVCKEKRRRQSAVICCIRYIFEPWKWHKAVGIAVNLVVVSVGISSTINFYQTRKLDRSSRRRILSKSSLGVFNGRG